MGEKKIVPGSEVENNLNQLLSHRLAGDPDNAAIVYTDLSPQQLSERLTPLGTPASRETIRQWMDTENLRLRQIEKVLSCGHSEHREQQFERIGELIETYQSMGNPVFSVDTKAKEYLGQLYRRGRVRSKKAFQAFDHDFPSLATGVIIPHGIYDLQRNHGHINIGLSHDTTQFACDSLRTFWEGYGPQHYPTARSILLLCDCGGSNSALKYIFKYDLQTLANGLGLEIRVAHYPSYCSKYNPIERRFFPHVARACAGMLFDNLETVVNLIGKTATKTGLTTSVNVIHQKYLTGRNATEEIKQNLKIVFDDLLPKWNYRAIPANPTLIY